MFSPALTSNDSLYLRLLEGIQAEARRKTKSKKKVRVVRDSETERQETEAEKRERLHPGHDELRKLSRGIASEANCGGRDRDREGHFSDTSTDGSYASDPSCPKEPTRKGSRKGATITDPKVKPCGCAVSSKDGCLERHPHRCRDGKKYSELDEGQDRQDAAYIAAIVRDEIEKVLNQFLQKQRRSRRGDGCSLDDLDALSRASKGALHKRSK